MKKIRGLMIVVMSLVVVVGPVHGAFASTATSNNYGVSEVRFGSGGELHACSTTYCAKQSAGELTVGNTKSTNYQAQAGANTDRQPFLEVVAPGGLIDFGVLDSTMAHTATTTFSIKTYLASGYVVTINGTSPTNKTSGHALNPMATAGPSVPGSEQFGLNLRANTTPSIGSDVTQSPSSQFGFGAPSAAYNVVNNFKYVAGDTIAYSDSSSGQTNFTMSMIANISNNTGGGSYNGRLILNVTPSF